MRKLLTIKNLFFVLFILASLFTRFYNLEGTARYTRDESQDLVDMHRIYVNHEITLIGPVDSTATVIYPSLTFYMLLPFAVMGNFEPASPAYGTAFFGVLAAIIILLLVKKLNPSLIVLSGVLLIICFPLVESSRWAWNPNLIPFFSAFAMLFFLRQGRISKFLSGVCFGLTFHLHYLSFIAFAGFIFSLFLYSIYKKKSNDVFFILLGFLVMIIPFVIFDLRNPPGLFFSYFLKNNAVSAGAQNELILFPKTFFSNLFNVGVLLTQSKYLAILFIAASLILIIFDILSKSYALIFLPAIIFQIGIISFLPSFGDRYFYPALIFFLTWLFYNRVQENPALQDGDELNSVASSSLGKPRLLRRGGCHKCKSTAGKLSRMIIILMILGNLFSIKGQLTQPIYPPDTYSVRLISSYIKNIIIEEDRKNVNLAVLASPDRDPLGAIYRHTLLVKGLRILGDNQYNLTDNLFVVTTSSEDVVRADPANIMTAFRDGPVVDFYQVKNSPWRVYLFNR